MLKSETSALDVEEKNKAYEILDQTTEYLDTIKIGYPITLALGPSIYNFNKRRDDVKIIAGP